MSLSVKTQGGSGGFFPSIIVTGLAKSDAVYAVKDGKSVRGKLMEKPLLPDGYTPLEYLESTGTQYINTKWSPTAKSGFEVEYSQTSIYSTSNNQLFGSIRVSGGTVKNRFYATLPSSQDSNVRVGVGSSQINLAASTALNTKFEINYHGSIIDSSWGRFTMEEAPAVVDTVYIFAINLVRTSDGTAAADQYSAARIYKLRFYEENTIVRNFVPAKRDSDNALGFYDTVNGAFYTNSGSGTFLAGAEISAMADCFSIAPLRKLGMWTVNATDGTRTATQDVLVDAVTEYQIEMSY